MTTVIHFTTVHPRNDTRIRIKQLSSLASSLDANVQLFVQDGLGDEHDEVANVRIHDTGARPKGRFARMTAGAWRMYRAVHLARPTIAHFHDPELIPVGLLLKLSGIKVIYDVHEDLPRQILAKTYIAAPLRRGLGVMASATEWIAGKSFDRIILAGATLSSRFPPLKSVCIYNYPKLEEFENLKQREGTFKSKQFVYVGGLSKTRGTIEMIRSIALVKDAEATLSLGGLFQPAAFQRIAEREVGWAKTKYHHFLDRPNVARLLDNSAAGLVLLHPTESYLRSYPTKMFEYLAAGLPVIASDFPFWRDMFDGIDCVIFVDPMNPQAISGAMQWILDNPIESEAMGARGREVVLRRFNWDVEAERLIGLYRALLEPQCKGRV